MSKMAEVEIAWAAGLFEGEGCIVERKGCIGAFQLHLGMTDSDVVEKYAKIVGGPKPIAIRKVPGRKQVYRHRLSKREEVYKILNEFLQFLGERRSSVAKHALQEIEAYWQVIDKTGKKPRPEGPAADRARERGRAWHAANRDKALARSRAWYQKNRKRSK